MDPAGTTWESDPVRLTTKEVGLTATIFLPTGWQRWCRGFAAKELSRLPVLCTPQHWSAAVAVIEPVDPEPTPPAHRISCRLTGPAATS